MKKIGILGSSVKVPRHKKDAQLANIPLSMVQKVSGDGSQT